jgi:hypothetical protein
LRSLRSKVSGYRVALVQERLKHVGIAITTCGGEVTFKSLSGVFVQSTFARMTHMLPSDEAELGGGLVARTVTPRVTKILIKFLKL